MSTLLLLGTEQHSTAANLAQQVERFQRQLVKSGYVSQSGTESMTDLNGTHCGGVGFSALWANPQSTYIVSGMPEMPGQTPNSNPPSRWRLRQDEAVVIIGVTPPPVAYFSFYLTMLRGSLSTAPILWVSDGDPISNMTVRTAGSTPYDRPFALVITGNRRTQAEVDKMLDAAGMDSATNNVTSPPAIFRLGLDAGSDEFFLATLTTVPPPGFEEALDKYRADPSLQIFRVRPKSDSAEETKPVASEGGAASEAGHVIQNPKKEEGHERKNFSLRNYVDSVAADTVRARSTSGPGR